MPLIMSVATDGGLVINNRRPEPLTCCQEQQDGTYTKILELLGDIEKIIELVDAKQSVDAPKGIPGSATNLLVLQGPVSKTSDTLDLDDIPAPGSPASSNNIPDASKETPDASVKSIDALKKTTDALKQTTDALKKTLDTSKITTDASKNTLDYLKTTPDDSKKIVEPANTVPDPLKSIPDPPVRWERASNGAVPKMAFVGGVDITGEKLYIARVLHDGDLTPGKVVPSHKKAYVPYYGKEYGYNEYEVLVPNGKLQWVSSTASGPLPSGAIQGGQNKRGVPMYVARVPHRNSITPGKFLPSLKTCFIPFDTKELAFSGSIELLVCVGPE